MGITLFALLGLDPAGLQRQAFPAGYRQLRNFSADHERRLNLFLAARGVVHSRFALASEFPDDQAIAQKYVLRVLDGIALWLR